MSENTMPEVGGEYKYGFKDDIEPLFTTGEGLTEDIVRQISAAKNEPEWMLDFRLKAYELYRKLPMPDFGPDLSPLDFEHINYFRRDSDRVARDWDDVPEEIKRRLIVLEFLKQNVNI